MWSKLFRTRRTKKSARRNRFQPRLEAFESRTLLSTVLWNNPAGGAWETASNWSTGVLPGPADDVVINTLDAGAVIRHVNDVTSIHSLTSNIANAGTIAFTGGSLYFTADSTLNANTTLALSVADIGGPGNLTLNGPLNWTQSGRLFGTGVTNANGGITWTGTNVKFQFVNHVLNNTGSATWNATGDFDMISGGVLNNLAGAKFTFQTDAG